MSLKKRVCQIQKRISLAQKKTKICLLAASKKQSVATMREAFDLGIHHFGENYVQEYREKVKHLKDLKIHWHFIGSLQSNKTKDVVGSFSIIHSVDRKKILQEINKWALEKNCIQKILLQVNFSMEESKSGFFEKEIPSILEILPSQKGVQVCGLMLMPKPGHHEVNRPIFARAKICAMKWNKYLTDGHHLTELSMGTSQDFEVAIQEGATIVRIGSKLLGSRA